MFSAHLNRYFNEPNEFLQELQSRFLLEQLRWLPLKWLTRCNVHARDSLPYPAEFFLPLLPRTLYADIMTEFSHTTTNLSSVMLQLFAFRLAI